MRRTETDTEPRASAGAPGELPTFACAGYGAGQIAGQIFRDTPSLLLLFFLTNALGISPVLAGATIFIPKFAWGILCDLGVGLASDRWGSRMPRRWWLLAGAIAAPAAMIALFRVPAGSEQFRATYVGLALGAYMLAYAVFYVPFLACGAEITRSPLERTRLMAWRQAFAGLGILLGISATPILVQRWGGRQDAYESASLLLAAAGFASLLVAFVSVSWTTRMRPGAGVGARGVGAGTARLGVAELRAVLRDRAFVVLAAAVFIQLVGSGMGYASVAYFMTYNAGRSDALTQLGLINLVSVVAIIGMQPVFVGLGRRISKRAIYCLCSVLHAVVQIVWGLSAQAPPAVLYGFGFLFGAMNAGWAVMTVSLLTDLMARDRIASGVDRGGAYSAIWAVIDKIAFALGGTLLTGALLQAFGFDAGAASVVGGRQPSSALTGTALAFAWIPAATNVVAAGVLWRWGKRFGED